MSKWDKRFLELAEHIAQWSKDPSTKCGAVIVDEDHRIIGIGYNGFPRGVKDEKGRLSDRQVKNMLTVHAETNAILNSTASVKGATLYVWPIPPCCDCAGNIIQSGITCVVSPTEFPDRWAESIIQARVAMDEAGVIFNA